MTSTLAIALAAAALALVGLVWLITHKRTPSPATPHAQAANPLPTAAEVDNPHGMLSLESILDLDTESTFDLTASIIVPQGVDEALVLGTETQAREIGKVLGKAGERVVSGMGQAGAAVDAAVMAQERQGFLVRLHPSDLEALKQNRMLNLNKPDGYIRGVVRGPDGKFVNVARFKDAAKLSSLASGAAIVSALATQAKLDQIERQLGKIQQSVNRVQGSINDRRDASRRSTARILGEVYRVARATGQLTPAQWDQLAPLAHEIYALQEQSLIDLDRITREAGDLPAKARDRGERLRELESEVDAVLLGMDRDDRTAVQFQALRLWHMSCSEDPALAETVSDTNRELERRSEIREEKLGLLESAFGDPDVTRRLQKWHVLHRRRIRKSGATLAGRVQGSRGSSGRAEQDSESAHLLRGSASPVEIGSVADEAKALRDPGEDETAVSVCGVPAEDRDSIPALLFKILVAGETLLAVGRVCLHGWQRKEGYAALTNRRLLVVHDDSFIDHGVVDEEIPTSSIGGVVISAAHGPMGGPDLRVTTDTGRFVLHFGQDCNLQFVQTMTELMNQPSRDARPTLSGQVIDVAGGEQLHVEVRNAEMSGPAVICSNGLGGDVSDWRQMSQWLPTMTCVSFDRPGLGQSPTAQRSSQRLATECDRLMSVADAVVPGRDLIVVGWSYGGIIAEVVARLHSPPVTGLVLVDSQPLNPDLRVRISDRGGDVLKKRSAAAKAENGRIKPHTEEAKEVVARTDLGAIQTGVLATPGNSEAIKRFPDATHKVIKTNHRMMATEPRAVAEVIRGLRSNPPS